MANFKVGQRVRVIGATRQHRLIGREAIVVGPLAVYDHSEHQLAYLVDVPGDPHPIWGSWTALPEHLAPLEDPRAAAFVESIKRLKPYEEPKVEPRISVHQQDNGK